VSPDGRKEDRMSKKPADRRPDQKPTGPGAGTYAPGNPERDRMPDDVQERKRPIDKPLPKPGAGGKGKGKDFFEGERSDRESGRPVQLEGDEENERSDRASGRPVQLDGDGQSKSRQGRSLREAEPTQR
jgi:hypothetical protein